MVDEIGDSIFFMWKNKEICSVEMQFPNTISVHSLYLQNIYLLFISFSCMYLLKRSKYTMGPILHPAQLTFYTDACIVAREVFYLHFVQKKNQ